jgi:hypothetical protein
MALTSNKDYGLIYLMQWINNNEWKWKVNCGQFLIKDECTSWKANASIAMIDN